MTSGFPEWIIILLAIFVLFVIFGPKQLPKLGKMFGKTIKSARQGIDEMNAELKAEDTSKADATDEKTASVDTELSAAADKGGEKK